MSTEARRPVGHLMPPAALAGLAPAADAQRIAEAILASAPADLVAEVAAAVAAGLSAQQRMQLH